MRNHLANFGRLVIFSVACAFGTTAFAAPSVAPPSVPTFEPVSCGFKDEAADWPAKNGVSCGWVTVKAHHEKSNSALLRLWVVKAARNGPATGENIPVIRIWYGPMATNITPALLKVGRLPADFRASRDIIYFDYRGMGRSEPKISCTASPVAGATIDDRLRSALAQERKCRRQVEAAGIDLSALNAGASSQDVQDIAQAMGYPAYDVWGASYGSFSALNLVRLRPAGLRAAIVGVAIPPDSSSREQFSTFALGLAAMQRECDGDVHCHARFPDMAASLGRAMARLDRERLLGRSRQLTPFDLLNGLWQTGAIFAKPEMVPLAIDTAEKGNAALVAKWLDAAKGDDFANITDPDAVAQTVLSCNSFATGGPTKPDVEAAGRRYPYLVRATRPTDGQDRFCDIWKIPQPPGDLHKPVQGDLPVLFYSARFDMAVLNSDTLRVAKLLPHSTIVEVPGAGHSFSDDCLFSLEAAFLVNPTGVLDRSCTAGMKPISFALDGFEPYVATVVAK